MFDSAVYGCNFRWRRFFSNWRVQLSKIVPMLGHSIYNRYFVCVTYPLQYREAYSVHNNLVDIVCRCVDASHFDRSDVEFSLRVT